jgi:hypothetical protein
LKALIVPPSKGSAQPIQQKAFQTCLQKRTNKYATRAKALEGIDCTSPPRIGEANPAKSVANLFAKANK